MTIEQYVKSQLGELQFALAVVMAERDSLKNEAELKKNDRPPET